MSIVIIIQVHFKTCYRFCIWQSVSICISKNSQCKGELNPCLTVVRIDSVVGHVRRLCWNTRDNSCFTASCCSTEGKPSRECRFNRPRSRFHTSEVWQDDEVGLIHVSFKDFSFSVVHSIAKNLDVKDITDFIVIAIKRSACNILWIGSTSNFVFIRPLIVIIIKVKFQVSFYSRNDVIWLSVTIGINPSSWVVRECIRTSSANTDRHCRSKWSITNAVTISISVVEQ